MKRRNGFSLLELILALGLSVILLSLVVTSIRLYMIQLERRTGDIEQQHVARGVVRMLGDDLRAAIQYKAQDYSALEDLIASQSLAGLVDLGESDVEAEELSQEDVEDSIFSAVDAGSDDAESEGQGAVGEDGEELEEEEETGRPTFFGSANFIRIDTSRLPRLDQYNPIINQQSQPLPSDIKTITYFFSQQPPPGEINTGDRFGIKGGLYRRQIDRAVEAFQNGEDDVEIVVDPDEFSELISPEISGVRFRFWDGQDWLSEWDSNEMMGFPSAVELVLIVDPDRTLAEIPIADLDRQEVDSIRSVVHLPAAEVIEEEDEEEIGEEG